MWCIALSACTSLIILIYIVKDILDWPGLASIDLWKNWESLHDYVLVIKQLGFQQAIKIWIMHKSPLPKKKCKRVGLRVFGCFWNFTAVIVKHTGASTALISSPGSWPGHCIIGIYTESCPAVKGFPIDRLTTFIPSAYCEFWIYWLNVNMTP